MLSIEQLAVHCIELLKSLIREVSYSGQEEQTATLIAEFLEKFGVDYKRKGNNIVVRNKYFDHQKNTILLNSHHDTVKVVNGWFYDPFGAMEEEGRIYGLGSNDAGASLVSLLATFLHFYQENLDFNLLFVASAEEENSGKNGIQSLLSSELSNIQLGIIGEPTGMNMAIAEKGLIVIDAISEGLAGHAARKEGINAIYLAMEDIRKLKNYEFKRNSKLLGPNILSVSQISGGKQHNITPDECHYVIDLRVNDQYTLQEAFSELNAITSANLKPRSMRYSSSSISKSHPVISAAKNLGIHLFGSPTLSDQALLPFNTVKIGPGQSERSHTPNEFIFTKEIEEAIPKYIQLLNTLNLSRND